jgi:hypothetical protein
MESQTFLRPWESQNWNAAKLKKQRITPSVPFAFRSLLRFSFLPKVLESAHFSKPPSLNTTILQIAIEPKHSKLQWSKAATPNFH